MPSRKNVLFAILVLATCSLVCAQTQETAELKRMQNEADWGNVDAAYNLAKAYEDGKGVPQDFGRADYWYSVAETGGNKAATQRRIAIKRHVAESEHKLNVAGKDFDTSPPVEESMFADENGNTQPTATPNKLVPSSNTIPGTPATITSLPVVTSSAPVPSPHVNIPASTPTPSPEKKATADNANSQLQALDLIQTELHNVSAQIAKLEQAEFTGQRGVIRRYALNYKEIEKQLEPLYKQRADISEKAFTLLPQKMKLQQAGAMPREADTGGTITTIDEFVKGKFAGAVFTSWSEPHLVYKQFRGTDWIGWGVKATFRLPQTYGSYEIEGLIVRGRLIAIFNKQPMLGEDIWIPGAD